jgi:Glycosyl transferase family 2
VRLVLTLLVRDEADIVESTIAYHLERGVDFVVVTDNGSVDGTRELVQPFARAGEARLIDEAGDDYSQARWVTRMARLAAADHGADWVLHADADEFWWPEAADLKDAFGELPPDCAVVQAPRENFPPSQAFDDRPFFERMTLRDTRSVNPLGQPLPPKCAHRAHPAVEVGQGNHWAIAPGFGSPRPLRGTTIFHFPARSYAQVERKIVLGGRAYARNQELPPEVGHAWRRLYALYLEGGLPEWYARQLPQPADAGRYVRDERLRDVLRNLSVQRELAHA